MRRVPGDVRRERDEKHRQAAAKARKYQRSEQGRAARGLWLLTPKGQAYLERERARLQRREGAA